MYGRLTFFCSQTEPIEDEELYGFEEGRKEIFFIYGAGQEEAAPFFCAPFFRTIQAVWGSYFSVHIRFVLYNVSYGQGDLPNN